MTTECGQTDGASDKGQGLPSPVSPVVTDVLVDPHRTRSDCRMLARAVKNRWHVADEVKELVVDRLTEIVDKRSISVTNREGDVNECEDTADSHAIAASRVLVAIVGQVQADDHMQIKADVATNAKPAGDTIIIGQTVNAARQLIVRDPGYIEYLRDRAAREDGYASAVGEVLQPGTLEAGQAPPVD